MAKQKATQGAAEEALTEEALTEDLAETEETPAGPDYLWSRVLQDTPTLAFGGWGTLQAGQIVEASARQVEAHPDIFAPLTPAEMDELVPDPERHPGRHPDHVPARG